MTRTIARGTLKLSGPSHLLESPTAAEMQTRIGETTFRTGFAAIGAREDVRLGLIESRIQLEYVCADLGIGGCFPSWAKKLGVSVEPIVSPRASHPRR